MQSLRDLPSIDQVVRTLNLDGIPRDVATKVVRAVIAERRQALNEGRAVPNMPVAAEAKRSLRVSFIGRLRMRAPERRSPPV